MHDLQAEGDGHPASYECKSGGSVQGGLEEWRGTEEGRQQECCCGNHRELAEGGLALRVVLVVRGKASRD